METKRELSRAERIEIISKRDGVLCFYPECRKEFKSEEDITFDHWWPRSHGGTWDIENLRLMHKRCNALKGDRLPLADGTLPPLRRELNSGQRRAVKRAQRIDVCGRCMAGRSLGPDDTCEACGSGPMPRHFPQWRKMRSNECDHDLFWCWACCIGIAERKPAILDVLNADELDE
jgi:hypothetical protein